MEKKLFGSLTAKNKKNGANPFAPRLNDIPPANSHNNPFAPATGRPNEETNFDNRIIGKTLELKNSCFQNDSGWGSTLSWIHDEEFKDDPEMRKYIHRYTAKNEFINHYITLLRKDKNNSGRQG